MRRGVHVDATHHSMASVDSQIDRMKVGSILGLMR